MSQLIWDANGERFYETGTRRGVLYLPDASGAYSKGVAWNGLTAVTESPEGAEANDLYADDIKYLSMRSAETFGATIEAYQAPAEFMELDGQKEIATGVFIGQQARGLFGFSYRTVLGNDLKLQNYAYKLHLVYGCTASPSEKSYQTINDSPEAVTMSWDVTTTPVNVAGYEPTASITIWSNKTDIAKLAALEQILYGSAEADPRLPLPDEIATLMAA